MKFKVRDIIEAIDEDDLYKMQADLRKGGIYLKKLVDDKLKEMENQKRGSCLTCGADLKGRDRTYTLIFGPDDFRRKASFCEQDCLEYFLSGMKKARPEITDGKTER